MKTNRRTSVPLSEAKVSLNKLRNFFLQNHVDADILQASFVLEKSIDKGIIKNCVYVPPLPADFPDLRYRIEAAVASITSDTLNKVCDELAYRIDVPPCDEWGSH
ncbi:hypothetical protein TNCV_2399671 [Trichonephila clavipes]|uniref:Uncharacterized protein n=1 Tax=Trichonephila clavipes TaxID=2585209 RepID=A0A8X6T0A6_TRICX|nr:hypothetical protein TNCV_2399671 [Trichonephila clavipes]